MPLLGCLVVVREELGSSRFLFSHMIGGPRVWFLLRVSAFLLKLPIYLTHLWLPKAHVEAPVAGSMLLAGILLKLAGYGLSVVVGLFITTWLNLRWVFVTIRVVGGVLVGLMCLWQVDIKSLIAYSSVAHIGLVLAGLIIFSWYGLRGAYRVMLGHGLCSSGLFFMANILYERRGRRSLLVSKGRINLIPRIRIW